MTVELKKNKPKPLLELTSDFLYNCIYIACIIMVTHLFLPFQLISVFPLLDKQLLPSYKK